MTNQLKSITIYIGSTEKKKDKDNPKKKGDKRQNMLGYIEYNPNDNKYYRVIVYDDNTIERIEIKEN